MICEFSRLMTASGFLENITDHIPLHLYYCKFSEFLPQASHTDDRPAGVVQFYIGLLHGKLHLLSVCDLTLGDN